MLSHGPGLQLRGLGCWRWWGTISFTFRFNEPISPSTQKILVGWRWISPLMNYVHAAGGWGTLWTWYSFIFCVQQAKFLLGEKLPMYFCCPILFEISRHLEPCEHIPRLNCTWSCCINSAYCLIVIDTNFRTARERPKNCFWENPFRVQKFAVARVWALS